MANTSSSPSTPDMSNTTSSSSPSTSAPAVPPLRSGYDLGIYGLSDGSFYTLHIIAISCLSVSLLCSSVTVLVSCSTKRGRNFFTRWQKRDRFVIYMAVCDGMYGACHLADHINVFVVKDHVYPKGLCIFYAFVVFVMIIAQNLLVNVIAINAFALMYFEKKLDFGRWDWRLHSWIFGVPVVCATVSTVLGRFGPTGAYCLFDGVTGGKFYLAMVSIPIIVILPTNALLYVLIWAKLYAQTSAIKKTVGRMSAGMKASHTAARSMALFIAAYMLQWWVAVLYGFWAAVSPPVPQIVVELVVSFANVGGFLNLLVFVIIQRGAASSSGSGSSGAGGGSGGGSGGGRNRPASSATGTQNTAFSVSLNDE